MLPASGYFISVTCPFFLNGLCERPHCHFRHVCPAEPNLQAKALPTEASTSVKSKPDLLLLVREAILQVQKEVEADKTEESPANGNNNALSDSVLKVCVSNLESAKTFPIELESKMGSSTESVQPQSEMKPVAEYKPTPISKLRKLHSLNKADHEYSPTSNASSKMLYVPESKSGPVDSVVYIPNPISTRTRIKTPERNFANNTKMETEVIDESSGEDGRFSDDDSKKASSESESDGAPKEESVSSKDEEPAPASGFDLVNKILLESTSCDTFMSAACARRVSTDPKSETASSKIASSTSRDKSGAIGGGASGKKRADVSSGKKKAQTSPGKLDVKSKRVSDKHSNESKKPMSVTSNSLSKGVLNKASSVLKQYNGGGGGGGSSIKRKRSVGDNEGISSSVKKERKQDTSASKSKSSLAEGAKAEPVVNRTKGNTSKSSSSETKVAANATVTNNKATDKPKQSKTNAVVVTKTKESDHKPKSKDVSRSSPSKSDADGPQASSNDMLDSIDVDVSDVDDEADRDEECLRIFNEYVPETNSSVAASKKAKEALSNDDCEPVIPSKLRVAHSSSSNRNSVQRAVPIAKYKPSPSQVMYERFLRVQQMVLENRDKANTDQLPQKGNTGVANKCVVETMGKQRIAHVPGGNLTSAAMTKTPSQRSRIVGTSNNSSSTVECTPAQTHDKGSQRIAHHPNSAVFVRPTIPAEFGSKVPTNVRQRYLNFIIDECVKIYTCEQDACDRGLSEEKAAYDRSANRTVYLNVVANTIKRLRSELPMSSKTKALSSSSTSQRITSHEFNLGGKKAANVSFSIERISSKDNDCLSGVNLYTALKKYILTEEQLVENGFPLSHPTEPGVTVILKPSVKRKSSTEKVCSRCGSTFVVSEIGVYLTKDECFYHWGRAYKMRTSGGYETRYSCCQAGLHSDGCCVGKLHVYEDDGDPLNLKGFVKTLPKSDPVDGNYGVYSLDCEMCYTNMGNELTRITVVDSNSKPVFESLVKPDNTIIDYNTRFSGIKESDLKDVQTTIRDVQAVLLNMFSDKTILIGHSLESDFKALKIVHKTVVDTSVVFPHKFGPPYKRALRTLVAECLKKIIQNDVNGHDSQEDAASCIQLMLWKAKEDMKMVY